MFLDSSCRVGERKGRRGEERAWGNGRGLDMGGVESKRQERRRGREDREKKVEDKGNEREGERERERDY
jgi:hypothetical protein